MSDEEEEEAKQQSNNDNDTLKQKLSVALSELQAVKQELHEAKIQLQNVQKQDILQEDDEEDISHITDSMIENTGQMLILWIFVLCQCIFGFLKYGPFYATPNECAILAPDFNENCNIYYIFPVQCITYFILFCFFVFCTCTKPKYSGFTDENLQELQNKQEKPIDDLRYAINNQRKRWDQLKFPFSILIALFVSELFFTVFASHVSRFWYLWQIGIDLFGYSLWFIYSSVAGKLAQLFCKCSKIHLNKNVLLSHIIAIFIASFAIFWLLISMFAQDFAFDLNALSKFAFVQIIIESILIIEWAHVVIESGVQHNYRKNKDDKMFKKRGDLLGNLWFIAAFILQILGQISLGFMKFFKSTCSNFDFRFWFEDKNKHCGSWMWLGQSCVFIVAFLILFIGLYSMPDGKDLILMEWNRLYFPLFIWIILLFLECLFSYTINTHYFVQIIIDFCGYIVFFVQALYVVQFRKYQKVLSTNDKGFVLISPKVTHTDHSDKFPKTQLYGCSTPNYRLLMMYFIFAGYALIFLITIIANFIMDVNSVREAAESMSDHYGKDSSVIESIAFIQIVFENTLLVEYIHVIIGPISQ